jgi:hypothetical protein
MTIAILFCDPKGSYALETDCELWGQERDARLYVGSHACVAHPPCARFCRLAGLVEKRWGYKKGDDGGCFASALANVRRVGGVLEHPAYSDAFSIYGIPAPRPGGWQRCIDGGWVAHVEQGRYGHRAKKATWLYAFGAGFLPSLDWRTSLDCESKALVSWCGNHTAADESRPRLGKKETSSTPPAFKEILLSMARSVRA